MQYNSIDNNTTRYQNSDACIRSLPFAERLAAIRGLIPCQPQNQTSNQNGVVRLAQPSNRYGYTTQRNY